jgi:hypothetical protein
MQQYQQQQKQRIPSPPASRNQHTLLHTYNANENPKVKQKKRVSSIKRRRRYLSNSRTGGDEREGGRHNAGACSRQRQVGKLAL